MKKLVKIGVLLTALLLGINVVKADDTCDNLTLYAKSTSDFVTYGNAYMNYGSTNYHYEKFTFKDSSNKSYTGYCRNAGWTAGKSNRTSQTYKCTDAVFDTADASVSARKKMYDAGIAEILKSGYSSVNNSSDYNFQVATTIALRAYEMFWPEFNTNGSNTEDVNYAHQYYVNKWNDDEEIKTLLKATVGSVKGDYSTAKTVSSITSSSNKGGTNLTNTIESQARTLLVKGLTAAKNYKTNGAATIKYSETINRSAVVTNSNGDSEYKIAVKYTFNISKFTSTNAYVKFNFNCENCNVFGVNYKIKANDKEISNGANLLDLIKEGNGTVNFVIEFTSTSKSYNCESINYDLSIDYYDSSISTQAYNMYSTACSKNTKCQHFYILYDDDAHKTISLDDSIELCTINCETIEAQCKKGDSKACKRLNEEFGGSCTGCSAYISNDKCYDDEVNSTLSIKEGYTSSDACGTNASSKPNILQCIINKSDNLGNSYQDKDLTTRYCSVWCKEDYYFTMPGNKELNSGRYFSLSAAIKGTKTCYTSAINTAQFEADLEAAQHALIDAYNDYTFNKNAAAVVGTEEETTTTYTIKYQNSNPICTETMEACKEEQAEIAAFNKANSTKYNGCVKKCQHPPIAYDQTEDEAKRACLERCSQYRKSLKTCKSIGKVNGVDCVKKSSQTSTTTETLSYKSYKADSFTWIGRTYTGGYTTTMPGSYPNITQSGSKFTYESKGKIECPSGCTLSGSTYTCKNVSGTCTVTDGVSMSTIFNSGTVASKLSVLKNAYGVSTTSGGIFTEGGKPISPPTSSGVPGMSLIGVISSYNYCSAWTMDYTFDPDMFFWYEDSYMNSVNTDVMETIGNVTVDSKPTELRCAGTVDSSYETCSTGWTSSYLSTSKSIFVCNPDGSGCSTQNFSIAATSRMKSSMNGNVSYITPTQFYTIYPSGAIAVAEEGKEIENASALPNGLPVGLGTPAGVYNYTLVVENLGEYYDTGKLGRVWGDHDSVISVTLKENDNCREDAALKESVTINGTYFDEGVYNCAYKVNCPDCPVVCDPDCENPDCPDNDCPTVCDPPCVYNDDSNISYRPITSDDLNPNDRELGKNWQFDENNITTALELKAYATTKEIEENGETIYDINFESTDSDFAMKVTMDSKMISKIRTYNEKYEDSDGYVNNTLNCYDHTNPNDGTVYKNVYCYSTFIDELLYDKETKDNISITPKNSRVIGKDAKESDKLRKTKTQLSGYWTTWSEANLNKWSVTTTQGLAYYKANYADIGVGPSWK